MKTTLLIAAALLCSGTLPAFAGKKHRHKHYKHHHNHHYRHYHRRPAVSVGFYSGPAYYTPAPYYWGPPAVVYSRPQTVYVDRPVYVDAPVVKTSVERDVQAALAKQGYYGGVIDGTVGPQTRAAIRAYQVDKSLPVTGRVDGNLLRSLRLL